MTIREAASKQGQTVIWTILCRRPSASCAYFTHFLGGKYRYMQADEGRVLAILVDRLQPCRRVLKSLRLFPIPVLPHTYGHIPMTLSNIHTGTGIHTFRHLQISS